MRIYGLFILLVPLVPQSLNYIRVVQIVKCFRQTQLSFYNVLSVFLLILAVITRKISMKWDFML